MLNNLAANASMPMGRLAPSVFLNLIHVPALAHPAPPDESLPSAVDAAIQGWMEVSVLLQSFYCVI